MEKVDYKRVKLGDIASFKYGAYIKSSEIQEKGGYPVYSGYRITGYQDKYIYDEPQLLVVARGVGGTGDVKISPSQCTITNLSIVINLNKKIADKKYLFYKFQNHNLRYLDSGSAQSQITIQDLSNLDLSLPPLSEQKRIANILSSFDNKIEQLKKENNILENIAQSIFKEWFVKYNFPNNNGKPYRDSGGKMIDSELGLIPDGWGVGKLGDYFPVRTGKRNANHARPNGKYKFFTCSQETFLCDEYSFDDGALLLAGNGDFNIKWYKGKFDAYQRTYVLIPYEQENLGYLYFLMKYYLNDIIIGNRGSVISFITKGMIEDFRVSIPEKRIQDDGIRHLEIIRNKIEANKEEILNNYKAKDRLLKYLIT